MQMRIRVVLIYLMIACCEKKKVTVFKHRQTFSLFNYQFDCFFCVVFCLCRFADGKKRFTHCRSFKIGIPNESFERLWQKRENIICIAYHKIE